MNSSKKVDPRHAEYLKSVLQKMKEDPASLSSTENRLAGKYVHHSESTNSIAQDISQMRNQIQQAEARLRSLELQVERESGKAQNCVEILIEMKFEESKAPPAPPRLRKDPLESVLPASTTKKKQTRAKARS